MNLAPAHRELSHANKGDPHVERADHSVCIPLLLIHGLGVSKDRN